MALKRIEFPAGSGRFAEYDDREREMLRRLVRASELAGLPPAKEALVLHEAKVEFGMHLIDDDLSA